MAILLSLFTFFTRVACGFFLIAAGFCIPEAWRLNESEYTRDGSEGQIVFVPLEICDKPSITINDQIIMFNDADVSNCHTLEYLINACVASIFFSGVALLVFFLFDSLARCNAGPVSRSSVLGMSFFLTFIFIQTAACLYALYKECSYWEEYFMDRFAEVDGIAVSDVRTYGDKRIFFATCILALGCAGLLLIDTPLQFCAEDSSTPVRRNKEYDSPQSPQTSASIDLASIPSPVPPSPPHERMVSSTPRGGGAFSEATSDACSFAQDSAIPSDTTNSRKWTNY